MKIEFGIMGNKKEIKNVFSWNFVINCEILLSLHPNLTDTVLEHSQSSASNNCTPCRLKIFIMSIKKCKLFTHFSEAAEVIYPSIRQQEASPHPAPGMSPHKKSFGSPFSVAMDSFHPTNLTNRYVTVTNLYTL